MIASAICVCLVTAFPFAVAADQPPDPGWQRVSQLAPNTEITVTMRGAKPIEHRFVRADEATLVVKTSRFLRPAAVEQLARDNVLEVDGPPLGHPQLKGAVIGAAIGAGIGLIVLAACDSKDVACSGVGAILTFVGPLIGAETGAAVGRLRATRDVIYRAPQP